MKRGAVPGWVRGRWKRLLLSAGVLAVFFGNSGFRSLVSNYIELRRLQSQIDRLQAQKAQETQRLELIKTGDSAVERLARLELGFVKKGEIEYRFPPPKAEP